MNKTSQHFEIKPPISSILLCGHSHIHIRKISKRYRIKKKMAPIIMGEFKLTSFLKPYRSGQWELNVLPQFVEFDTSDYIPDA